MIHVNKVIENLNEGGEMKRTYHWDKKEKENILRVNGLSQLESEKLVNALDSYTFVELDNLKRALVLICKDSDEHRKEYDALDFWWEWEKKSSDELVEA